MTRWQPQPRPEIIALRREKEIQFAMRHPDMPSQYRREADIRNLESDIADMRLRNHLDVKSGDQPRFSEDEIEKKVEAIRLLTSATNSVEVE